MNEEIKQQAHEEFDKQLTHISWNGQREVNSICVSIKKKDDPIFEKESEMVKKHKSFIDSVIDNAVQKTEERIVGVIDNYSNTVNFDEWSSDELISLITNKSDINK